jgi:hypothetical protein
MELLLNVIKWILLSLLGLIVLIMLIGAWPFFSKKEPEQTANRFSLPSLDEIEANNAKKLQRRLIFSFALLTILGFVLAGQCKGEEAPLLKNLYWLGIIFIAAGPMLLLFSLDDKVATVLSQKRVLLVELGLVIVSGVAELVYFITHDDSNAVPLLSFKGATFFFTFVGIFGFLFFRVISKLSDNSGE